MTCNVLLNRMLTCFHCTKINKISAFRYCVTLSIVLQSNTNTKALSTMETGYDIFVFRHDRLQFPI